ncbi:PAS domain-containing protein [Mycolicibacterium sp. CBMA 226]|uniref:PAS domain-containing protein n=1 Tax=Mycolicibacterium sp. CBMA 226 TaxID=2606611 RepID=UPI001316CC04|nr:hypothetical protein ICEMyc226_00294 [Mycolicibacterium sp.]
MADGSIIEAIAAGLAVVDRGGRFRYINAAGAAILAVADVSDGLGAPSPFETAMPEAACDAVYANERIGSADASFVVPHYPSGRRPIGSLSIPPAVSAHKAVRPRSAIRGKLLTVTATARRHPSQQLDPHSSAMRKALFRRWPRKVILTHLNAAARHDAVKRWAKPPATRGVGQHHLRCCLPDVHLTMSVPPMPLRTAVFDEG